MRLEYVITHSFLQIIAVQRQSLSLYQVYDLSYDILPEVWMRSKQNDVVFNKFGKPNILAGGQVTISENYSDERKIADAHARLLNQIKAAARPFQRPVLNFHTPTEIHVRAALYKIFDLDHRNNIATISGYFHIWWIDPALKWNASEFNNITRTFIPTKWFWKPELYLYHSIHGNVLDYASNALAEISVSGRLRIFVPITTHALCPISVKYFPFDVQNCTFACGSWSYQIEYVSLIVDQREVLLDDFYDSQEWLLENAIIHNGTMDLEHESFSTIYMILILRRQSFYYVFNFVFPTALVSFVAVIGFHAPSNATGRHESKFRLGIITLLSMSVMLLMLADEMKFASESFPGERGSFYDVPLLAVFHMVQMLVISVATCTSLMFVYLEKYALQNQHIEVNITECHQETAISEAVADPPPPINTQRIELLVNLMREFIKVKEEAQRKHCLPLYWKRIIRRLENISLTIYLFLIITNVVMFMCHELWY
ncbi:unnamed protein product [Litomosoides sigmodontis]|uniref:Neurotransmitter-gated ion-channel ligand-binding domain-containing protein n=1 Tax=Litomosoides sigmodontis TaxID=42156 RepID=A0A3P6TYP0_LITSI|nr:unnamed protein product [Litomosoides sigmodontis]